MTHPQLTATPRPGQLRWDGACLREGVARRPWMAGGMGTDDARTTATNQACHQPQRWVEKVDSSIKGSDTPHSPSFGRFDSFAASLAVDGRVRGLGRLGLSCPIRRWCPDSGPYLRMAVLSPQPGGDCEERSGLVGEVPLARWLAGLEGDWSGVHRPGTSGVGGV
jgi:hypothetical protein